MRFPLVCHRALTLSLFGAGLALGLAAAEPDREAAIQLPKYIVTGDRELPPPESWHYARISGFEVLSNSSENKTRDLLTSFQRFANAVNLVWPGMVPRSATPAALIICGRRDQFGEFLGPTARAAERTTVSATFRTHEMAAIVLDVQTKELNLTAAGGAGFVSATPVLDEDGAATGSGHDPGYAVDVYQQLYREYVRFLLSNHEPRPPAWFAEGLAQLFMGMEVTSTSITLGKLEDPNTQSPATGATRGAQLQSRDFNTALARTALMPLSEMFAVPPDNPPGVGSAWAMQCYLFVHWGLYGDEGAHQKNFYTFVSRLDREPRSEALFKECFSQGYDDMLFVLRGYIEFTRHKIAGVRAAKGEKLPEALPVVLREATEAEVGRLKGETLRLAGQPAAAHAAMIIPYIRGERDPALLAALGIAEAADGDTAKATKLLEAAAHAQVVRPRAYVELARLRLAEAHANPTGATGRLSSSQTVSVLEPLFVARSQPPVLPEIYDLIAQTWSQCETAPSGAHLAVLDEGVRSNLRDAALVYDTAALNLRSGRVAETAALIRLGLRVATDDATRVKFEALRAGLPAPAKN